MSRLGDCLTAEPSIESARRGIRSAVSDGAIRARHVFLAACASPPSGVVCAHEDRLLFACGHTHNYPAPSNLGAWPDSPDYQHQADISPARRKRGERSSGGNRIHSGSRHYHEDGNRTDDAGRRWNLKKDFASKLFHALCRVALITLTTPHH